ncbi:MAG: hypothetical protein QOK11_2194, partial [Pseudonocardiales bacterium]|nr:hypothetical protein [Pseudonocardiales bacterium]
TPCVVDVPVLVVAGELGEFDPFPGEPLLDELHAAPAATRTATPTTTPMRLDR